MRSTSAKNRSVSQGMTSHTLLSPRLVAFWRHKDNGKRNISFWRKIGFLSYKSFPFSCFSLNVSFYLLFVFSFNLKSSSLDTLTVSLAGKQNLPFKKKKRRMLWVWYCIWWWSLSSRNLGCIGYPFIEITPRSTLTRSGRIRPSAIYGK